MIKWGDQRIRTAALLVATTLLLASCDESNGFCETTGDNLLQDPEFALRNKAGGFLEWNSSQHAGEKSFEATATDGVLTIDKIGTQPWFNFRQKIPAKKLAGKKLVFTAEIKLDLSEPQLAQGFKVGGGLQIAAKAGNKLALRSLMNHEPILGKTQWQVVQVVIELPEKSSTVEVGFLHQADGTLRVRKPHFALVDDSDHECPLTAGVVLGNPRQSSGLR